MPMQTMAALIQTQVKMSSNSMQSREKHPIHEELGGYEGSKLAMWLFLATELLLFGVLFATFIVFHVKYLDSFKLSHYSLDKVMGGTNTLVLILSSLCVALALDSIQRGRRKLCCWLLTGTIVLAGVFLVIKYFEYSHKFHIGIFPGDAGVIKDPVSHTYVNTKEYISGLFTDPGEIKHMLNGINLFFAMYFVMTAIHGLHVIIGMSVLAWICYKCANGRYTHWAYTEVENGALYWHLVDLIWIFLFPLFYLIS